MRVLLDECVHNLVKRELTSHSVSTVQEAGWRGIKNGELLRISATTYDVFITSDKNLEYQQHKDALPIPVIVIGTKGNMWEDIEPIIPKINVLLSSKLKNEFYKVL
jgi:hypothetical protein